MLTIIHSAHGNQIGVVVKSLLHICNPNLSILVNLCNMIAPLCYNIQEIGVADSDKARNRFFFDVTFFIIVTTIGLNIVFGIIVDTFSELRDEKVKRL